MSRYDVKSILESNTLPIGGGAAKRLKEAQAIESSRKRDEMIALGSSSFNYGAAPLQAYPLMHQSHPFEQSQPLLTLQNQDHSSPYNNTQDPQFHHNYIQTQLNLHHHNSALTPYNLNNSTNSAQFYNSYLQNNPVLLHGLMNMGGSSSSVNVMDNNRSSSGSYNGGGYLGNNANSGNGEELAMVKVDYDMPSASYNGWSGDSSVQVSNPGVFTMWND